ncbi:MAG: acyl-CoA dehydrogenase family protein [Microbacteriaceae bacterium]
MSATTTKTASPQVTERDARAVAEAAREVEWLRPSFAKGIYLGDFDLSLIHPLPTLDEGTIARGDAFLASLTGYCKTLDGSRIEREDLIPDEYIAGLADLGAFGMKIPVEYGGLGLPLVYYGRALMVIGSVHPSLGALLSAHQSIGVPEPVKMFGSEEQKKKYLPRCSAGAISAFLLTEPDVGSDPARMQATATLTEDGSAYLIDAVKLWTTNGVIAELLVVMANVPAHDGTRGGITAFVVEADTPGITVENRNAFMGLKGMENGVTRFYQVRVPVENRIGNEGQGLKIALTTLNTGRLSIPALCAAGAKWSLKIAREWSSERVQWGKPVGRHEAVAKKLAYMAATTFALESVFEFSASLADAGLKDVRIEAALAKLWSSEQAYIVADELIQIRGGRGYETADSLAARGERAVPAERLLRDMRINRVFEGSSEIMRLLIAREAVDAHLAAAGALGSTESGTAAKLGAALKASGFYAGWLPKLVLGPGSFPGSYQAFGQLAGHLRFVERASRRLARATFVAMARWQTRLEQKQALLGRIVDIGAELFAMAVVCVRAQGMQSRNAEEAANALQLADTFCAQSRLRVAGLFRSISQNSDMLDAALAAAVLSGEASWLEGGIIDPSEGTGPWIADTTPRPSTMPDQHRNIVRP